MLPCSLRYIDGEAYLYYDITSRQNIAQLFEKKPITRQWIMDFLWSMRRVRQEMSRFLLEESNIVWFPQHVYQDLEKKEFYFIYVPYCTEKTGFDELMEYLVEHVDYQDESLVEYVYKAYEQYESAGEVYLQAKIFEDAECLRIPEKMDAVEEETTVVVGQDQEKDAIREEEKEMPVGEVTVIKEKKGLFNLWENRKKKEKQERDNYTRSLQLTMTGYAVAEETRPGEWMPVYENERGSYIFNSRDLCMIEHIPEMVEAGIDSFKIEGRMKTALYVATVARTYRIAIDDYLESPEKYQSMMEWYKSEIRKCTHREYITGFYFHKPGTESQVYGSNTYVKPYTYLGTVGAVRGDGLVHLEQKNKFSVGETIEIMKPDGRNLRVEVKGIFTEDGTAQESAPHPKQQLWVDLGGMAKPQDILRREDEALDL